MTPERWQQVEEVLQRALDRPAPDRVSFLDEACSGDEDLRADATSLISAYEEAGDFIEQPALVHDARLLIGNDGEHQLGREIGAYTIIERLGAGGMGEVYLAQDARLGRLVALKILPAYFASDDARLRRFQREAQAASALNHPNILTIHEVGDADDTRFIATEFIDGETVRELIASQELSLSDILHVTEQVASALSAAHAAGIVHRDIKPENIMRRPDGLVKILDFGIAKLVEVPTESSATVTRTHTEIGVVMGTVGYMSPEQARGLPVDERTDVWSLGVVLYEMLSGSLPFRGATRMDTMVAILEREPPPLSEVAPTLYPASEQLQAILDKALRKETGERYQTTAELMADLRAVRAHLSAEPDANFLETSQPRRSGLRPYFTVFVLVGLLAAAIAGTLLYRRMIMRPANSAAEVNAPVKLYTQMSEAEQLKFVADQEQRIALMMGDHPSKLNDEAVRAIKAFVDRYVAFDSRPDGGSTLSELYGRAKPYVPLIAESFAARKVPVIIGIYLPVVESAYRDCYENPIGAKGLFQFLPQTARHYGVTRDEMCDPQKMTPAAAHYIADLMAELGEDSESVTLVLLSYNRGPESVRDSLRRLRGTANYERNFWALYAHRGEMDDTFQKESAYYVPNFFAATIIGENPQTFGLQQPPLSSLK